MNQDRITSLPENDLLSRLTHTEVVRKEFVLSVAEKFFTIEQRRQISPAIIEQVLELLFEEGEDWYDSEGQFQLEISTRIYLETLLMKKLPS